MARLAFFIASEWVAERGGDYALGLVGERLRHLLAHVEEDPLFCDPAIVVKSSITYVGAHFHYGLHVKECVQLLARCHNHPLALDLIDQLLRGDWDGPVTMPVSSEISPRETTRYKVAAYRLHAPFGEPGTALDVPVLLCAAGRLDYPRFLDLYRRFPRLIPFSQFWQGAVPLAASSPAEREVHNFVQTLGWTIIQDWDLTSLGWLHQHHVTCRGSHWLIAACERVTKLGLTTLVEEGYGSNPIRILKMMARTEGLMPDEDADVVVERLRGFGAQTLKAVLPFADGLHALVLQALDWEDMKPVLAWMHGFRTVYEQMSARMSAGEPRYADGPEVDAEIQQAVAALLADGKGERLKEVAALFNGQDYREEAALTSLEALAGWNRKALEKSITRYHKHLALTAYGFVPIRDEAELLERYLLFKKAAKDCARYGAERQANTRAAVRVGLANLAQTAGYPDLARLEWAMEVKVGRDGAPLDQRETVADWDVELSLDGLEPKLAVFKQGKPLKTVPAGLRKLERFLTFKDTQANLKAQTTRFRAALENMMAAGETLAPGDVRNLAGLAVVNRLLRGVILRDAAGRYGLFDPNGPSLSGLDGAKTALDSAVLIAHPYHFFQDGVLPAWQKEIVRRHIVQPFKQAFRELYLLTPAEEETAVYSNRFAGHSLKSNVAGRLLQTRNWRLIGHGDWVEVKKAFGKAGLTAQFDFPDVYGHFSLVDSVTADQIHFFAAGRQPVALKDVPPLIFSEVMRDADLVVSVAQLDGQDSHWSTESYQRREELITALIGDLGLKGVHCEGHFAHVSGKRANYRVHLGSAVIHIEPGNYLCIVPARGEKHDNLFLPFADAEPKTSEVISKILLLANDHKIKDPSILAQIDAAASRVGA